MYHPGAVRATGTGVLGAGALAYTGFDAALYVLLGLIAIVTGLLLLRSAIVRRVDRSAGVSSVPPKDVAP